MLSRVRCDQREQLASPVSACSSAVDRRLCMAPGPLGVALTGMVSPQTSCLCPRRLHFRDVTALLRGKCPRQLGTRFADRGYRLRRRGHPVEIAMAKYGPKASEKVEQALHEMHQGKLRSGPGGSGGKVRSRKQAIAIGLSQARKAGAKVPSKR